MAVCGDACLACHAACRRAIKRCLRLDGDVASPQRLMRLTECAALADTCAEFCVDDSPECAPVCEATAKVCEDLARDLDRFEDDELRRCAAACIECARACKSVVEQVPA
jgi:hypothetical protein